MCAYFTSLKGKPTGIEFIDSTCIKVCHNICIPRHKAFSGIARRGKGTMGWFYGFKLHLIVNYQGEIVAAKVTTGNVHDTQPVEASAQGLTPVTCMAIKAKAISLWDRAILWKRFIIEIINDQLKNTSYIEHSSPRSMNAFMLNLLVGLVAYCLSRSQVN